MSDVIAWQRDEPREALHRAMQILARGGLVVFPTDTVYAAAASGLIADAVARLASAAAEGELTLALPGAGELEAWLPGLGMIGRRLARRTWPGPLTLASRQGVEQGLVSRLEEPVRRRLTGDGRLRVRAPGHEAILEVLELAGGPLVLTDAASNGTGPARTAEEAVQLFGDRAELVLDAGACYFGRPATLVEVEGEAWQVLREGPLPAETLAGLTPCRIVFVCTGNTCRSPLAQALFTKLLAERIGCAAEELPQRGYIVESAGIAALAGGEPTAEAVAVGRELGVDLTGHKSRPLTHELVAQSDHLIAMARSHVRALAGALVPGSPRPRLLAAGGEDVPDPIGGSEDVYRECALCIQQHLQALLSELITG